MISFTIIAEADQISLEYLCFICLNENHSMELILDLHLHSRFSRAVSQKMNLVNMAVYARKKGIHVLSVADFTHPVWFKEAKGQLEEQSEGLFKLKDQQEQDAGPYFLLSVEVSSIYSERGKQHRIHNLIFAPSFLVAEKINRSFLQHGFNLGSDGRPILGISSRNLAELLFSIDSNIVLIPCHAWTPWFSLYGSRSGYDSIEDCFGSYSKNIYAVETGLSSDPAMNWRIKELENRSIVSFSDAHSLEKMGREATVLKSRIRNQESGISEITYRDIIDAFKRKPDGKLEIAYTIEFYPEEGKYHYTGHRLCGVSYSPSETQIKGTLCPVCKKPLTVGVMHRVDELAHEASENFRLEKDSYGVVWVKDTKGMRPSFVSLVPLLEVLAEALSSGTSSLSVISLYDTLVSYFGSEFGVLLKASLPEIKKIAGDRVSEGIEKVRTRNINIIPGFDGEFGKVEIWGNERAPKIEETQLGFGF